MSIPPPFSRRLPWQATTNRLAQAISARRVAGRPFFDLTVSNPTAVGLTPPADELAAALAPAVGAGHQEPLGLPAAREALAAFLTRRGDSVDPEDLVLTASTSEAYSYLFKLFGNPGDAVLTPRPSYPLLDHLAALEGLELEHCSLELGQRWQLDPDAVAGAISPRTRLLVFVHPGNPTGAYLLSSELESLRTLGSERGLPLVTDEVFADYPLAPPRERAGAGAATDRGLAFTLGGLSKSAGLPHWKLGWIRIGGEAHERRRARAALELVADTYLALATPVQQALPGILELVPAVQARIRQRLLINLAALRAAVAAQPALRLLPVEGGWTAVLRVPRWTDDEGMTVDLLERSGVLVHPGYFFDFASEGFLVLSLLPETARFEEGVARLVAGVASAEAAPADHRSA